MEIWNLNILIGKCDKIIKSLSDGNDQKKKIKLKKKKKTNKHSSQDICYISRVLKFIHIQKQKQKKIPLHFSK